MDRLSIFMSRTCDQIGALGRQHCPSSVVSFCITVKEELVFLATLSLPSVTQGLCESSFLLVDLAFLGHLGKGQLAAAAMGNALFSAVWSFIEGAMTGQDTMAAHAFGRGDMRNVRYWSLVSALVTVILSSIGTIILIFSPAAMKSLFFFNSHLASKASQYIYMQIPGLWALAFFRVEQKYLQAQGIMFPSMYCALVGSLLNVICNYLLIYAFGIGFAGCALATSLARIVMCLLLTRYIYKLLIPPETKALRRFVKVLHKILTTATASSTCTFPSFTPSILSLLSPSRTAPLTSDTTMRDRNDDAQSVNATAYITTAYSTILLISLRAADTIISVIPKQRGKINPSEDATGASWSLLRSDEGRDNDDSDVNLYGNQDNDDNTESSDDDEDDIDIQQGGNRVGVNISEDVEDIRIRIIKKERPGSGLSQQSKSIDSDAVGLEMVSLEEDRNSNAFMNDNGLGIVDKKGDGGRMKDSRGRKADIENSDTSQVMNEIHASVEEGEGKREDDLVDSPHPNNQGKITAKTLCLGSFRYLLIGLPGGLMLGLENWMFDVGLIMVSQLGTIAVDVTQIIFVMTTFVFIAIPFSISIAATLRIGNLLGQQDPARARVTTLVSMIIGFLFMSLSSMTVYSMIEYLGYFFTSDPSVMYRLKNLVGIASGFQVVYGIQGLAKGVLRATGRQASLAFVTLLSLWGVGLPTAYFLTFISRPTYELPGFLYGIFSGVSLLALVLLVLVISIDWPLEVKRALMRAERLQRGDGYQPLPRPASLNVGGLQLFNVRSEIEDEEMSN